MTPAAVRPAGNWVVPASERVPPATLNEYRFSPVHYPGELPRRPVPGCDRGTCSRRSERRRGLRMSAMEGRDADVPDTNTRSLLQLLDFRRAAGARHGCTQLDLAAPRMPWDDDEEEVVPPQKIVAFWSDTVLHQQGQPAVRGFGGRVFFYADDEKKPLEVDGAVIVYAFDADRHDPATQTAGKEVRLHGRPARRPSQPIADGTVVQLLAAVGWRARRNPQHQPRRALRRNVTGPW